MSTRPWEIQDSRESHFPTAAPHLGWGTWWEPESRAQFYQTCPSPQHLPFLETENMVCQESVVLGDASVAAAQEHTAGDRGFRTDRHRLQGRGRRASQNRWTTVWLETSATYRASSPKPPQTILLSIHSNAHGAHYSWTRNIQRLPTADRTDFSDCHLLCFPTLPHPSLPTTSLPAQVILRTPVSLVPPFPSRVFPSPKCCSIFAFSPLFLFSCPSQDGACATSSMKPSLTIPPHSDPASPLSSFVVRCLPGDRSCDTLMCEGLSFQLSYKRLKSQALALVSAECLRMRAVSGQGCSRRKLRSEEILMPRPYLPEILILLFWGGGGGDAGRTNYIICRAA